MQSGPWKERGRQTGPDAFLGQGEKNGDSMSDQFSNRVRRIRAFFYFCIFQKKILQKYIFGFRFYSSILLPPGK